MLTINEIKNKKFDKSAFGYKVEDVEAFLNQVIDYATALENEKAETEKKLVVLANKIEEYRNQEDSLSQVLLGAQKLSDNILKEAKNRAEIIMRDATIKSENIIKNVKDDVKREEVILNKMKREVDTFKTKMLTMYSSHIDMLKSIPEIEHEKEEVKEESEVKEEPMVVEAAPVDEPVKEEAVPEVAEQVITEPAQEPVKQEEEIQVQESAKEEPKEEGFKISGGFKFSRFDENEPKKESKFGPLKFGDSYDLDDDNKR